MTESTKKYPITRVEEGKKEAAEAEVVREYALTVKINGEELAVVAATPHEIEFLAVGLAESQGILKDQTDIKEVVVENDETIDILTTMPGEIPRDLMVTSSGGRSSRKFFAETMHTDSEQTIPGQQAMDLMEEFEHMSRDFKVTGGVHSAALCDSKSLRYFSEDVGRHNAIDKVFGKCILDGLKPEDFFIITSGRVSSDIMLKIVKRRVPVLIARNSPTDVAIDMAEKAGITLLGFVRGNTMNIYTNEWRVV